MLLRRSCGIAVLVLLSVPAARAQTAVAQAAWPKVIGSFPVGDKFMMEVGQYEITREPPVSALERARGGRGGPMIAITLHDEATKWRARLLHESCGERLLEDFNGRPQLEIWTRDGEALWARTLFRYLATAYRAVRVDRWQEAPSENKDAPRTKPPFSLHGDENAEALYFIRTDIPAQESILADSYRIESPEDQFPQIIQRHNYDTIVFIEALYARLKTLAPGKGSTDELSDSAMLEAGAEGLIFRSKNDPRKAVTLRRPDTQTVLVDKRRFAGEPSAALVRSLFNLCGDLATTADCREVRYTQFGNRAYKTRTLIEFDFGARVVHIDSMSNGPRDEERLYVLDLVERDRSFFWPPRP